MSQHNPDQYLLDFTSRENDSRRMLRAALKQISGAKLEHWDLLWWIYNIENENGGLKKTANEIADVLWCHPRSAWRVIEFLANHDLIKIIEHHANSGSQQPNEYRVNWEGVKRRFADALSDIGLKAQSKTVTPECQPVTPLCQTATPPCQTVMGGWQNGTRTKETLSLGNLFKQSGPVPETEPIWDELMRNPALGSAAAVQVAALTANSLDKGAFVSLESKHLDSTPSLVEWFQRQLSVASPVCGHTETELILVLAAGLYAAKMPQQDVRKNRVAVFIHTITRQKWRRVYRYVPEAKKRLDDLLVSAGRAYWRCSQEVANV